MNFLTKGCGCSCGRRSKSGLSGCQGRRSREKSTKRARTEEKISFLSWQWSDWSGGRARWRCQRWDHGAVGFKAGSREIEHENEREAEGMVPFRSGEMERCLVVGFISGFLEESVNRAKIIKFWSDGWNHPSNWFWSDGHRTPPLSDEIRGEAKSTQVRHKPTRVAGVADTCPRTFLSVLVLLRFTFLFSVRNEFRFAPSVCYNVNLLDF